MPSPLELARAISSELTSIRRDLHQHPEIAWEEVRTGQKTADFCGSLGLQVVRAAKTGTIATLNAEKPGPVLAFRADMDALPIQEESDIPYKSVYPGKAHLCGHEANMTMLLGAVKILAHYRQFIPFPVRFIFQPAEEIAAGAVEVIKAEQLSGVTEIFGLHLDPGLPVGVLGTRTGPLMASMDRVVIDVEGHGGHGATPQQALDPVLTGAEITLALQSIASRRVAPVDSVVVSICQVEAGSTFNVIPSRLRLTGTTRALTSATRDKLPGWIDDIAVNIARAHGQTARTRYERGATVLVNHAVSAEKMKTAFNALGGEACDVPPTMMGEDFAQYVELIPGAFAFVGCNGGTPETSRNLHNPRFNFDERALQWGTATLLQLVCERAGLGSPAKLPAW